MLLGLAGLFIAVSMAGLWSFLPEVPHKIVLALFGLALFAALVALVRVRSPSREEAIRRVEGVSGIKHRPASSYEDTLTLGAEDARTAALWRVHRTRLAEMLKKLRVGRPEPRTDRMDPYALRALLLLSVFVLTIVVGDSASDRLAAAFRFGPLARAPTPASTPGSPRRPIPARPPSCWPTAPTITMARVPAPPIGLLVRTRCPTAAC